MPRATGALLIGILSIAAWTCSCTDVPEPNDGNEGAEAVAETSAEGSRSAGTDSLSEVSPSADSLSEQVRQKLDPALKLLLREGPENPFYSYQASVREGQAVAYSVLIRTRDPSALRSAGLLASTVSEGEARPDSSAAQVVSTRLTTGEIRQAARLKSVLSISNPAEAEPH